MHVRHQHERNYEKEGINQPLASHTIPAPPSGTPQDWFLLETGNFESAGDYITELTRRMQVRNQFTTFLSDLLKPKKSGSRSDTVTEIGLRLRTVENTLQFRLAVLNPEKSASWFRKPLSQRAGPFASQLLDEPVFPEHDLAKAGVIRAALNHCWQIRSLVDQPFNGKQCLWTTLLEINAQLENLQVLKYNDQTLRLRTGMSLPSELASATLERFLANLAGELEKARIRLDACFDTLMSACVRFWDCQFEQTRAKEVAEDKQRQQKRDASSSSDGKNPNFWQRTHSRRENMSLESRDIAALKFLGFEAVPTIEELRKRYLVLARRLHPDVNGGRDTDFKKLVESYQRLQNLTLPRPNVDLNTQL